MFKTKAKGITFILLSFFITSYASAAEGVISIESQFSVEETGNRFESILAKKGVTLFARIDHKKNAKSVNLTLGEIETFIFGNPKIGTPLMQCSQVAAIDLPQKVLIWKDANNKVQVSYNNPEYIKQRHDIKGCDKVIAKISNVLSALTNAAATK